MEIRYKNNNDKLLLLGIPMVLLLISSFTTNIIFIGFSISVALAITFVVGNYIIKYYRKTVVIYTKDRVLHIRSNGKYNIPFKDMTKVYHYNKKLYIEFVKNNKPQRIYLSDLYDHSLEQIHKKLKNKIK